MIEMNSVCSHVAGRSLYAALVELVEARLSAGHEVTAVTKCPSLISMTCCQRQRRRQCLAVCMPCICCNAPSVEGEETKRLRPVDGSMPLAGSGHSGWSFAPPPPGKLSRAHQRHQYPPHQRRHHTPSLNFHLHHPPHRHQRCPQTQTSQPPPASPQSRATSPPRPARAAGPARRARSTTSLFSVLV